LKGTSSEEGQGLAGAEISTSSITILSRTTSGRTRTRTRADITWISIKLPIVKNKGVAITGEGPSSRTGTSGGARIGRSRRAAIGQRDGVSRSTRAVSYGGIEITLEGIGVGLSGHHGDHTGQSNN